MSFPSIHDVQSSHQKIRNVKLIQQFHSIILFTHSNQFKQRQTVHKLQTATFWDIYRVNKKKSGISGILADFGKFFSQPVMATNIIKNFTIFEIF